MKICLPGGHLSDTSIFHTFLINVVVECYYKLWWNEKVLIYFSLSFVLSHIIFPLSSKL